MGRGDVDCAWCGKYATVVLAAAAAAYSHDSIVIEWIIMLCTHRNLPMYVSQQLLLLYAPSASLVLSARESLQRCLAMSPQSEVRIFNCSMA